jgi:hypothetical protein
MRFFVGIWASLGRLLYATEIVVTFNRRGLSCSRSWGSRGLSTCAVAFESLAALANKFKAINYRHHASTEVRVSARGVSRWQQSSNILRGATRRSLGMH